ncbi:hypothetical protein ALC56_04310, partial [Trachymyrmex septentrionalis]
KYFSLTHAKNELTLALVALSNVWPLNRIVLSVAAISSTPATSTRKEVIQCHQPPELMSFNATTLNENIA